MEKEKILESNSSKSNFNSNIYIYLQYKALVSRYTNLSSILTDIVYQLKYSVINRYNNNQKGFIKNLLILIIL